jgi:hypothetical protein
MDTFFYFYTGFKEITDFFTKIFNRKSHVGSQLGKFLILIKQLLSDKTFLGQDKN